MPTERPEVRRPYTMSEPTIGMSRRFPAPRLSPWSGLVGAGLLAAFVTVLPVGWWLRVGLVGGAALVAIVTIGIATARRRPPHLWIWPTFAIGIVLVATATAFGASRWNSDPDGARQVFLTLQVSGHLCLFAGFCGAARIRRPTGDISSVLDAIILGLAIGLIAWRATFSSALDRF